MRRALAPFVLLAVAFSAPAFGGGKKKYEDPTPRKEMILKRFVGEFVHLKPGVGKHPARFVMGTKDGAAVEKPARTVTLKEPFAISTYEVTQELYHVVMGDNPSRWKGPRNSVEMVDWKQAVEFCRKLTKELRARKLLKAGEEVRLPTEAEWEYACRAGTQGPYSFGADVAELTHYAWYKDNSKGHDPPVGAKKANPWGLYDMHGYIFEWCADSWHPNYDGAPADGSVWKGGKGGHRVIRSGAWSAPADAARSTARQGVPENTRSDAIGFRCVIARTSGE